MRVAGTYVSKREHALSHGVKGASMQVIAIAVVGVSIVLLGRKHYCAIIYNVAADNGSCSDSVTSINSSTSSSLGSDSNISSGPK